MNNPKQGALELLKNSKNYQCECGNEVFTQVHKLRIIPKVLTGSPVDITMPLEHWECTNCKKLAIDLLDPDIQQYVYGIGGEQQPTIEL